MSSGEDQHPSRAERVLDHIATYGLTITSIVSRLFCDNSQSKTQNLFRKLHERSLVVAYTLDRTAGLKYYVLSVKGSEGRVPFVGVGKLSGKSVHTAVSVLCFCHGQPDASGAKTIRRRVSLEELEREPSLGFSPKSKRAPYVIEQSPEQYIGRAIVPGPQALPSYAINEISRDARRLTGLAEARKWLATGGYRYVVLVQSEARKALFAESIDVAQTRQRIPKGVRIDVVCVPDPAALKEPST